MTIFVACQSASLYDLESYQKRNQLSSDQVAELDDYFSQKLDEEFDNGDYNYLAKRDALWTTTEVLECIRRLKYSVKATKLDLVTEMLNCYRRLKHSG